MGTTSEQWKGVLVPNASVRATIQKYGAPVHSKPHGPDETILYYEDPAFTAKEQESPEDFAGTITPGSRSMVEQTILPHSAIAGTAVRGENRVAGTPPSAGLGGRNLYASPNELTRESEVEGNLDPNILGQEEEALSARALLHERDTVAGEGRPAANERQVLGTPFIGSTGAAAGSGPVSISFLDDARKEAIRSGLRSGDPELREMAEVAVDQLLAMIPSAPAASDEGLDRASHAEPVFPGRVIEESPPAPRDEIPIVIEQEGTLTPRGELQKLHPEWTFAFLDGKSKGELEDLADEAEKLGIKVERTDQKDLPLRREDYITALRTDQI